MLKNPWLEFGLDLQSVSIIVFQCKYPFSRNTHSATLFHKLQILPIFNINNLQLACFMYSAIHGLLPFYFINMFDVNSSIHTTTPDKKTKFTKLATNKICINLLSLLLVLFYGKQYLLIYVSYPT